MIDQLLYYPHFCIAAAVATLMLLIMYFLKRNFITRSNRIFFVMLVDNLLASLINITTFYVISFPEKYPLWVCYLSNIIYLIIYNMMAVLFLLYVDSKTKISKMEKATKVIAGAVAVYDFLLITTSPFTRLAIYFDEKMAYCHGPLMITLYITAFLVVAVGNIMFIKVRKKFNFYQIFSITCFVFGIFGGVIFQAIYSRVVITNYVCAMALAFIFIAFENQAYYLYGDTPCYNRRAFIRRVHLYKSNQTDYVVTAVQIKNYESIVRMLGRMGADTLSERIAERMSLTFGKKAYCIDTNSFAILEEGKGNAEKVSRLVQNCFAHSFNVDLEYKIRRVKVFPLITTIRVREQEIEGYEMVDALKKLEESAGYEGAVIDDVEELIAPLRRERKLLSIIDRAIQNDGFEVYYQPILDVKADKFVSSEALVRLKDDEGNFISPEEFIPIAERCGRINDIGKLVFREVCRFIRDEKLISLGVKYVEINLSPEQCKREGLSEWIVEVMKEFEIKPEQLNLEITETSEVEKHGFLRLNEIMSELHGEGVTFSLDDFGSGFAAINYLTNLPVDIVKIDKGILWQAMEDETSMMILKSTIHMIQKIGRKIVVEGIETEEMAVLLKEHRCDYLQGYFYSKPVPAEEYIEFLKSA